VAMVPKPAEKNTQQWASATTLEEFWILAPLGDDRGELAKVAARARNGATLPVQEPSARHYAFLRAWVRDLIRGGCAEHPAAGCETAAEATPNTRIWIPLGAKDPFLPTVKERARYDIVVEAAATKKPGVTVTYFAKPEGVPAGNGEFAQACLGCAAFKDKTSTAYTMPELVENLAIPLGFRVGFRDGESVAVTRDSVIVTRTGVSGPTRIILTSRQGDQPPRSITLKPAAGSKLVVDIVNATGDEIAGAGLESDEHARMEHFKLLYLLAPRPGNGFVFDYPSYYAPETDTKAPQPAVGPNTDPFCTKPGQLKPPPK